MEEESITDKHTPLPWYVHDLTGMGGSISISATTPDHITIADMGPALTNTKEEQLANAELIVNVHNTNQQLQQQIESLKKTLQEMTHKAKLESRYDDVVKAAFYDVIRQAEEALK